MSEFLLAGVAEGIAREAGALLREFYAKGVAMEYKGDVDLVTEADRASEALIKARLSEAFPEHGIYGEEGTREGLEREFRWYVDPLDGTTNFAHGFPVFCVVLGCERRAAGLSADEDGEMVAGVIYDPLRDEAFVAERGKGAWLNGKRIHVSKAKTLQESLTGTGFPSSKRHENPNVHFYQEMTLRSHGVRRAGSAALDLAYVACGRLDGYWEFKLNPWDTSAGYLLVEEAGGTVTHFDGGKFTLDSREVFATNGLIKDEMQHIFTEMFAGRGMERIPTPAEFRARRETSEP
ncbi:inositol monophosphatase family protein [Granulicella tundricola]|uniref:Inositol-1-monophosphatase n=1 Tax=Granulicella tundricola (strain ATCC BAA-1859 / DSM 23138 / MP5ACTX9) TaxID=1198114 RepID=E8WWJ0_GRATM|nr:inositol monophosphatase family protein [Granulicella tundricola]ADW69654.1 inositol monophosphatase [Granulicella tundricola MP5ACTX9]